MPAILIMDGDNQRLDAIRRESRKDGKESLQVAREYTEAMTAKEPERPVFNEMMEAVERGEAAGLLAWHPDRLSRNSRRWPNHLRTGYRQASGAGFPNVLVREHASGPILGTFKFSLTSERKRAVTVGGGASRINRRRLPASEWLRRGSPSSASGSRKPFNFSLISRNLAKIQTGGVC